MPHDIIDNRDQKLVDHINRILPGTEAAKFAVGYFFLSGLEAIQDKLAGVKELRLLIGNTSSRETIEQISEGYKRLELVQSTEEAERYLKKADQQLRAEDTAGNLRKTVALMDQTDGGEALVNTLIDLIEQKRMQVKVFTKGRLHAKAYIFDYEPDKYESGIAVVGSSNLSLSGLSHNTELNVVVHGNDNHAQLTEWFEELWKDSQDFEAHLMEELKASWAGSLATPYDIYMKSLYSLIADRLEDIEKGEILWDDEITRSLADFQKVAVRQAIQIIRDHGGAFVSDVVGLGKSYIGAGIIKHFHRTQRARALIICPKPLEEMWRDYNAEFELNAEVVPLSMLRHDEEDEVQSILKQKRYEDRDLVLIDESHNFRHHSSQRYEVLQSYLAKGGKKVCLLTATPRNKSAKDVYNQIKLFHQDDITHLPIDPPNLKDYFKQIEDGEKKLQDLLVHILIRRTRRHILRYYGYTEDTNRPMRELGEEKASTYLEGSKRAYVIVSGKHQFFPQRQLQTLRYSIESTYHGLYQKIRRYLGQHAGSNYIPEPGIELTYARYGLWNYVKEDKQEVAPYNDLHSAGVNLRGLIRVMLFKRFESSVFAFRETLIRLEKIHDVFIKALDEGFVPAGKDAQRLLYESDQYDEPDLLDALESYSGKYDLKDFEAVKLREHLEKDQKLIQEIISLVKPITPKKDAKLKLFLSKLKKGFPKRTGKVLIFTQFADTAKYVYEAVIDAGSFTNVECIYGSQKSKARISARFAPVANQHIKVGEDKEINILIATDVMSEGLNLQDGDVVVNYDLHWNPVRLIQRFGRIDRIGSKNDEIWGFNFLPELELERQLGLEAVLKSRIQEIHNSIGEDSAILDKSEQLNAEAMFCIYENKEGGGNQLSLFEKDEGDLVDLNEAEEMLRSLRSDDPEEFNRIANLRDGIRSAKAVFSETGTYVFCQAGNFQQLFLLDESGKIISRDAPAILAKLKCGKIEPSSVLTKTHNKAVSSIMETFKSEVKHRKAQQQHTLSLGVGQIYILRELRAFYTTLDEEEQELKRQISTLEDSFKRAITTAVRRQLNVIRKNGIAGRDLLSLLAEIYHDHDMGNKSFDLKLKSDYVAEEQPRVICSEAFV